MRCARFMATIHTSRPAMFACTHMPLLSWVIIPLLLPPPPFWFFLLYVLLWYIHPYLQNDLPGAVVSGCNWILGIWTISNHSLPSSHPLSSICMLFRGGGQRLQVGRLFHIITILFCALYISCSLSAMHSPSCWTISPPSLLPLPCKPYFTK